ncbi:caspase family protein [Dactylosporangium sp. McL0621]|uniref:caspase family protein n=1 Tax=Dactylosporangium sp. McL0621 TaxID=3415678 RepID=UPI003CEC427A
MYRALVVCNSTYPEDPVHLPNLHGPQVDGLYLWRQLTDDNVGMFSENNVAVLFERSQRDVFEKIENFFRSARSGDTLLFYFSGHGQLAGGSLYLCLRDTLVSHIRSTGISTDEIGKIINDSFAESIIILLDCCFSGGFKGKPSTGLTGTGRYIISATTSVDVANDSAEVGTPSPFTEALLESLQLGAEDSDHDGYVDIDDVFRDVEARLGEEFSRPERDFDGAGRVAMAKRLQRPEPELVEHGPAAPELPGKLADSPSIVAYLRNLSLARRRQGDFSVADMRGSVMSISLSLALIACSAMAFRFVFAESHNQYVSDDHNYLPEEIAIASACALGVIQLILGILEKFVVEKRLPRRLSRRRYLLQYDRRAPKVVRGMQTGFAVPAAVLCLGPLSGRGFVTASWVATWTCLALITLIAAARLTKLGDAAFVASSVLLFLGNCIPFEFDPGPDQSSGFYSGLNAGSGVIAFGVGLLMAGAWWWRVSPPILASLFALGLLTLISSAADAFRGNYPHWFLSITALAASCISLASGAGQLLPLQGKAAGRFTRNVAGSRDR